jgi:hypothetical protein
MLDRLLSVAVAVSLALLVWIYARSRDQEVLDNVPVPVQVVLNPSQADHYNLELTSATTVPVSFTGSPQRIREVHAMLQRKELQAAVTVTVPDDKLSVNRLSETVVIEASAIHAPLGVTALVPEGSNRIPYTLHRLAERRLPVRVDSLRDSSTVTPIIEPATVLVRGPVEVLDRCLAIPTEPTDQLSRSGGNVVKVPLVDQLDGRPIRVTPREVKIRVPSQSRKIYELTDVQIQFLLPPDFSLKPKFPFERDGKINLRISGPDQEEPPKVFVFVDLTRGKFISGVNHEPLQIQLPRDFQLAQDPPRPLGFELTPADVIPGGLSISPPG